MNDSLVYLTTATLILAAIALIAQTIFLLSLLKSVKAVQEKLSELMPKAESFLDSAEKTMLDSRRQITDVSTNANAVMATASQILDIAHAQVVRVDDLVTDATGRARVQMDRVELMLDDTMTRVQETVTSVHGNILKPIREAKAVSNGIRTAIQTLVKGNRPNVDQATSDEEMFI